jgi:hypothetical protein
VRISPRLREKYPEEMTIVLQHQFWDLIVGEEGFEVGLSFNGIPERLGVPFMAIKGFFDPSVQFALQFDVGAKDAEAPGEPEAAPTPVPAGAPDAKARRAPRSRKPQLPAAPAPTVSDAPPVAEKPSEASGDKTDRPASGAEVVRLDRFRKK